MRMKFLAASARTGMMLYSGRSSTRTSAWGVWGNADPSVAIEAAAKTMLNSMFAGCSASIMRVKYKYNLLL